jgi:hypothetical protein
VSELIATAGPDDLPTANGTTVNPDATGILVKLKRGDCGFWIEHRRLAWFLGERPAFPLTCGQIESELALVAFPRTAIKKQFLSDLMPREGVHKRCKLYR